MQPTKLWRGRLAIAICLVFFAAGSWACEDISWDTGGERRDWSERDPSPRKRRAYGEGVRCFDSFGKFKRAMENEGRKKQFEERNLHCTDNLVYLSKEDHGKLNGYYSRHDPRWGAQTVIARFPQRRGLPHPV